MISLRKTGNIFTAAGILMITAAAVLFSYNVSTSGKAGEASEKAVSAFYRNIAEISGEERVAADTSDISDVYSEIYSRYSDRADEIPEEKYFENEGTVFVSVIKIPVLNIELPVCSELTMSDMKMYPCRYSGSVQENDIIIAAHNYSSHFGNISSLQPGDEVILLSADGREYRYSVTETEIIPGNAVKDMFNGGWDLTLFTCDTGGRNRITVRCAVKNQ